MRTGTRTVVALTKRLGKSEHLARLFGDLTFLAAVPGCVERADLRNDVARERARKDLSGSGSASSAHDRALVGEQLVESGASGAAGGLIRRDANGAQTRDVANRPQAPCTARSPCSSRRERAGARARIVSGLTSGITSGTPSRMRNVELLSITYEPRFNERGCVASRLRLHRSQRRRRRTPRNASSSARARRAFAAERTAPRERATRKRPSVVDRHVALLAARAGSSRRRRRSPRRPRHSTSHQKTESNRSQPVASS